MPHRNVPKNQRGNARRLRGAMTDAECKLWQHLRAHRFHGFAFRRQVPVGRYIVDFICHDMRLVIEVDGGQHGQSARARVDRDRTDWLRSHGYLVIRFWNNEVLSNLGGVLRQIETALRATPPSRTTAKRPSDLPLKGGGVSEVRP